MRQKLTGRSISRIFEAHGRQTENKSMHHQSAAVKGRSSGRRLAIACSLLMAIVVPIISQVASELIRNDIVNEQPERWRMESYMSALVPAGGAPSQSAPIGDSNSSDIIVHEREFVSPQAKVQIECQKDKTVIRLNFSKPFTGIIGAGSLERTKCKINGDKSGHYELEVLHNETRCDTQWDSATNSIFNTLFVRFHPSLETGADLAKNIMCRLSVGDVFVGRRPARTAQGIKRKLKLSTAAAAQRKLSS